MNNPNKQWSWNIALGRGIGSAIGAGGAAATAAALGTGGLGAPIGAAIGAAGGFVGGFLGTAFGYWLDDPSPYAESFNSAVLMNMVVSGFVAMTFLLLGADQISHSTDPRIGIIALCNFAGFLTTSLSSVLDDMRARNYAGKVF